MFARAVAQAMKNVVREVPFIVRSIRFLRTVDLVLVAGSGQLTSAWGGAWFFPYHLWKWTLLARFSGARVAYLSIGGGPIEGFLSTRMIRSALSMADFKAFRDSYTGELIERLGGISGRYHLYPDLVFNLREHSRGPAAQSDSEPTVGINPIPYRDRRYPFWPVDQSKYDDYVTKLAEITKWLAGQGYRVRLFGTTVNTDSLVVKDILDKLSITTTSQHDDPIAGVRVASMQDVMTAMSACDYMIASRFHGILIALLKRIPTIGLAYHPKTFDMMGYLGQRNHCFDIESFSTGDVQRSFKVVTAGREAILRALSDRLAERAAEVEAEYDAVFSLLPSKQGKSIRETSAPL